MNNFYECRDCGSIEIRDSKKNKIKSFCSKNDKMSKLVKIESSDAIKKLCDIHLIEELGLSHLSKAKALSLKIAFKHGIKVMLDKIGMK